MFPALRPYMGVISQLSSWLCVPPWVGPARNSELRKQLKPNQKTFLFQILQIELIGFLDIRGVCMGCHPIFLDVYRTPGIWPFPPWRPKNDNRTRNPPTRGTDVFRPMFLNGAAKRAKVLFISRRFDLITDIQQRTQTAAAGAHTPPI